MSLSAFNPCLSCGACCAFYRASFYWTEAESGTGTGIPVVLTEKLTHHLLVMKGTNAKNPRCVCLNGTIGEQVYCDIYPQRSSSCRDFQYAWHDGQPNPRCDKARAAWNLPPLPEPNPIEPDQPTTPRAA